jgi:triosephosphate isomerase (TIM)
LNRFATPVIAGNWKMHLGPRAAADFCRAFAAAHPPAADRSVLLFPSTLAFAAVRDALRDRSDIGLGVQNIHWEPKGAFTGEVSAPMAAEAGARYVLCGHSERRHVFGEADADVGRKVAAALDAGLTPVLCVGETLEERRAGQLQDVLARQLEAGLAPAGTRAADAILAYEPVWAIGTGETATPTDAADAHGFLRSLLSRIGGHAVHAPILYGGSVKPDNAAALLAAGDVDGLLVGGASLDPTSFARIAAAGAAG